MPQHVRRNVIASLCVVLCCVVVRPFAPPRLDARTRMRNNKLGRFAAAQESHTDDEWHPRDPAYTTPQLLEGMWFQIAQAKDMVRGETTTVIYPQMEEEFKKPRFLNLLFAHLDACKDVCDHFGITTTLVPYKQMGRVVGFTVKSFRDPDKPVEGDGTFEFDYDPYWDDGTDFEALYDGIDDEDMVPDPYPTIDNKIPDDDEEIIDITKDWVSSMMSDMGVCPFSQGAEKAGLPVGDVFYSVDRSTGFEDVYNRYWKEVVRLEQNTEKDMSTILLITPEFCYDNVELFDSFTTTLTQPLTALGIENLLQLVFFHPSWSFRDGGARSGSEQAANYARRSPWPMINLLRTTQVRAAQKGIPTGLVYKQNEKTLSKIGVEKLETMLRLRDWTDTAEHKVNRREIDALKIAQDFQQTGQVSAKDTSLAYDSTPAANKVERRQVEQGNLVNVLLEALQKRLATKDGYVVPLSGPETSATAMASDFLLHELEILIETGRTPVTEGAVRESSPATVSVAEPASERVETPFEEEETAEFEDDELPEELARARKERLEAAKRALMDDVAENHRIPRQGPAAGSGDPMQDILFGKGGIPQRAGEEENFPEGMDPNSFY